MTEAANEHPREHMGLPLSHGKLAMWLFLVTEIMFFTALIGMYIVLRNGTPTHSGVSWPTPDDVHLVEWIGALNTFVLIVSSLTVVLAHYEAHHGNFKNATKYIGVTLALGLVFLVVKAIEYDSKFSHTILPGRIGELATPSEEKLNKLTEKEREQVPKLLERRERDHYRVAMEYVDRVKTMLGEMLKDVDESNLSEQPEYLQMCFALNKDMSQEFVGGGYKAPLTPTEVGDRVNAILHKIEETDQHPEHHLPPAIPFGNLWASCYFAMTGFHALHVLGGLVVFGIILIMGMRNKLGPQHVSMLELVGLYWHFVDIVWIFLFPLLYLV